MVHRVLEVQGSSLFPSRCRSSPFTLMGTVSSPGFIPRSLEYVFKLVDAAQVPMYKPSDNGSDQLNYIQQDNELQWVKRLRHISAPLRDKYRRMSVNLHNELTISSSDLTNRTKCYVWWVKRLRHISAPLRDKYRRMSVNLHNELTISSSDLTNRTKCYVWEIFEKVVKGNLKKLPDGQSFTLLVHRVLEVQGSSLFPLRCRSSPFTLMGTVSSPGLIPRSLEYVFKLVDAAQVPMYKPSDNGSDQLNYIQQDNEWQWVKRLRHISAPLRDKYRRMSVNLHNELTISSSDLTNRTKCYVWVSFVEIYNEAIYDLLAPPERRTKLRIREDSSGNVYVKDVTQAFVRSGEEAYDIMVAGKHNLVVAATGVHANSSRSHCIFTITMLTEKDGEIRTSHVRLCDLAGCERQRAARNVGARLQESRAINSSLHVLERCMHMLRKKQRHLKDSLVPYRESKLTRLLGAGLSGSRGEAVSMVVTLNPAPRYVAETRHVLALAGVAQTLQTNMTLCTSSSTLSLEASAQDTTIACSAELMRLRAENERLHFELLQAQVRNQELVAGMEERQLQNANTIREMVEEAKDMTREFFESEIRRLKAKMEDMKEDYESELASAASAEDADTRHLRAKVKQLETQVEYLEDELTKEQLARARNQNELQHLHECIEERDESGNETAMDKPDEVVLTDSDPEDDDDTDPLNQSLEPIFKRENQNRSHVHKTQARQPDISEYIEDTIDLTEENEITDDSGDASNDQLKCYESVARLEDQTVDKTIDKDRSDSVELIDASTHLIGTYCVSNEEIQNEIIKKSNLIRGTYFVDQSVPNSSSQEVKQDTNEQNKETKTLQIAETFIGKITQSLKTNQGSDSLTQFEQLEKEVTDDVDSKDNETTNLVNVKILKEKKTYFDDATASKTEPNIGTEKHIESKSETVAITKNQESTRDRFSHLSVVAKLQEKQLYFDDTEKKSELLTSNVQAQKSPFQKKIEINKHGIVSPSKTKLYFDDNDKASTNDFKISRSRTEKAKVHEKPSHSEDNTIKNVSNTSKNEEKGQYFDSNEKLMTDDVIISRSGNEKRAYFDNISVNLHSGTNKKVNDIITNSRKYEERSPSIVKDDFVPSVATIKLLGESYMKPEPLSSIHKNKIAKKQESVDIFESPQINIAKHIEEADMKPKVNVEKTEENFEDCCELPTVTKPKELSNIEVIRKSIERLVLEQKLKAGANHERKLDPKSCNEELLTHNIIKSTIDIKDASNNEMDTNKSSKDDHPKLKMESESTDIKLVPTSVSKELLAENELKSKKDWKRDHHEIHDEISKNKLKTDFNIEKLLIDKKQTCITGSFDDKPNLITDAIPVTTVNMSDTSQKNNTIDEFENICKDLSNVRATEFELLVSQEANSSNNEKEQEKPVDVKSTDMHKIDKEMSEKTRQFEETKYNLRNKGKSIFNVSNEKEKNSEKVNKVFEGEEILAECHSKCERETKTTTKRSLRLRRRKHVDEDNSDQDNEKLKDIINLKKEFSDVTMGLPAAMKEVKDIPSPEKQTDADENVPPLYGIQSCPSKSVTRSRRKLFTPRAEPLEESLTQGDSSERLYVPRPSYHRGRARRKL